MSDFANNPKIDTIRKLLKKAESAAEIGHQVEADALNEKAMALIAKYSIDRALLAASGKINDAIVSRKFRISTNYTIDKKSLLHSIARGLGAQAITLRALRPGTKQSFFYYVHVFAYQSDMERIEFLFEMLQPQMLLGAAAAQAPWYENARSFRKSWMLGFQDAIIDRLQRNEKQAAAEAGAGTDIVLFDRSKAVEDQYNLAYPGATLTYRNLAGSGHNQGYVAGSRASLGDNHIGGSRLALPAGR